MPRPTLRWADLPGRRVGIYGLGVEGRASLAACRALGIEPILVDDNPNAETDLDARVLTIGDGGLDALRACEVVIKSPGISRYGEAVHALQAAGATTVGGLGLWLPSADLARVLVITGTKGKSTTTAIAGHLLSRWGYRAFVGGNIGRPPFDPAVGDEYDYWVIEVSSYQATDLPVSPPVTAVTSLNPDHLPWHADDVETYYRDKLSATSQPGARITVANGDSPLLRAHRAMLGPEVEWVHADDEPDARWVDGLGLIGAHNRRNALIARHALSEMGIQEASDDAAIATAAAGFAGLPHRLQVVGRRGDVIFVDDNLSTNVLPALAAVDAFPDRRVALLVGGQSRGIDYAPLGVGLRTRTAPLLLVTMPTNGPEIHAQVDAAASASAVTIADADSLAEAVRLAADWAAPDGVVLLSPAAPSFDLFHDYRARGAAFTDAMRTIGGTPS
ncbi:MAG: UDP-N-acetylmuramoylalanine--D-glutamate ligase [Actinobacteria bacterium 69-20]|jgi:UDP-N-acetylmuramoylalanine--D-glutamate ligase|nr:UDP-N-acetylmuramoyl-L-alanine--D-glutamate ligase [Actinomycetota bacterium]OJV24700.1 MAG: UDP-N-acetylmuramoylalanine--D-glutamate ligase [Actinobacteria bacterium 69-20]